MLVHPLKKIIRDPKTMVILSHDIATEVPDNAYWNRRVICGDCGRGTPPTKKTTKKPPLVAVPNIAHKE